MITIKELTNNFGKYLSNSEFEKLRFEKLINPTKYNSQLQFIRCKVSKIELSFTNERMIRESDVNKPLIGGKPIFTNFFIFPKTEKYFDTLPFGVTFKDDLSEIEKKCGKPNEVKKINNVIFGNVTSVFYFVENIKIIFTFDNLENKITQIGIEQLKKEITE